MDELEGHQQTAMTRDDLYHQVWSHPMTHVARELGKSDVAVAKMCKKLDVPVPPRGYWAKVQAGQDVEKTPLPPTIEDGAPATLPDGGPSKRTARGQRSESAPLPSTDDGVLIFEIELSHGATHVFIKVRSR